MAYEATPWDSYTTSALNQALGLMNKSVVDYPEYTPTESQAPASYEYYNYTATTPMAQISTPNYQGLMNQDYDALQQALTSPGVTAATNAYNAGSQALNSAMSGRGLYGSSIMGNQMNQGLNREYMNALSTNAANAAAQRYALQAEDLANLNKFNAQNYATGVDQNKNIWTANAAETANKSAYDAAKLGFIIDQENQLRNWKNAQDYEKYTYQLAKNAYENQATETLMNRALALAGQGAPLTEAAHNYQIAEAQNQTAKQAAADAARAENTKSWLSLAGSGLSGLLSNWDGIFG